MAVFPSQCGSFLLYMPACSSFTRARTHHLPPLQCSFSTKRGTLSFAASAGEGESRRRWWHFLAYLAAFEACVLQLGEGGSGILERERESPDCSVTEHEKPVLGGKAQAHCTPHHGLMHFTQLL